MIIRKYTPVTAAISTHEIGYDHKSIGIVGDILKKVKTHAIRKTHAPNTIIIDGVMEYPIPRMPPI